MYVDALIIEYCCNSSIIPLFQKAYRDWLCTQHIPVFSRNSPPSRIPPCGDFCSGVEHKCPFLRPLTETTYAGEPSFICKGKSGHAVRLRCPATLSPRIQITRLSTQLKSIKRKCMTLSSKLRLEAEYCLE